MKNPVAIGYISGVSSHINKISLDDMWKFIDDLTCSNKLTQERKILSYDDVFVIYSKLAEYDQAFRELLQIRLLQKETE